MKEAMIIPTWLLRLSLKQRLMLTLGALIISLGLYWLFFPATSLGAVLLLPIILVPIGLSSWFFGWRGGVTCLISMILLLAVRYGLNGSSAVQTSSWLTQLATIAPSGLIIVFIVGGIRRLKDALVSSQDQIARIEQAYEQECQLNQAQNQVLQTLNHEMRIPLTQIQGYLELLESSQGQIDPAMQVYFIEQANSGCEELLSLITTVLETTPGKSQPLHMEVFSLRHEIQTVLARLDPRMLQDYRLQLEIPAPIQVWADARMVRQVMRNLLTNAFKYSPPHKRIIVNATPLVANEEYDGEAGEICVRVIDEGPGIPPEQQGLLFQRFVRLPNAIASGQPGTGLGLAICKQLVETMGGRIWLESPTYMGEGCCFSFTLPSGRPPVQSLLEVEDEFSEDEQIGIGEVRDFLSVPSSADPLVQSAI